MKKIITILSLFLGISSFAQKTIYIFNNSATASIKIGDIQSIRATITGSTVAFNYPRFVSVTPTMITIPPGGSYTLENVANPNKFPFVSIGNTPQINQWKRFIAAFTSTTVSSAQAFTTATPQMFQSIKFMYGIAGTTFWNPAIWNNNSNGGGYNVLNYCLQNGGSPNNPIGLGGLAGTQWAQIEYDAPADPITGLPLIYGAGSYSIILTVNDN